MDLFAAFGVFLACVACCMVMGLPQFLALLVGLVCFFLVGLHRGHRAADLVQMTLTGMKTSVKVLRILVLIGLLTALWRAGGTVAFFVWGGAQLITPRTFILVAFLLPALFSLAFGSSFGVVGTAGVILMAIARSGGANLTVTAGAIISGIYVGERLSPASSSAALTAAVSGAEQRAFQHEMWRATPLPMALSLAVYGVLSILCPIRQVDSRIIEALESGFQLSWVTLLPAAAVLLLPWLKISAFLSIAVSCVLAAICALFVQGMDLGELLLACLAGYQTAQPGLADIMAGGGLSSMINVVLTVVLSCAYSGIFNGTGLLDPVTDRVGHLVDRVGLFPVHILLSFGCCGLFCNQAVGIVMGAQLMEGEYRRRGLDSMELAVNLGNSVLNLAGLVPWAISASVPLTTLGVGASALPLAVYLYLVSLCWWACLVWKEKKRKKAAAL